MFNQALGLVLISALCITVMSDSLGGYYVDPKHYTPGTLGGTRYLSDMTGNQPSTTITLVGSDDGVTFWTLLGKYTDKATGKLTVDFSPKGGPADLSGTYADGKITWQDGNAWTRQSSMTKEPECTTTT